VARGGNRSYSKNEKQCFVEILHVRQEPFDKYSEQRRHIHLKKKAVEYGTATIPRADPPRSPFEEGIAPYNAWITVADL
jgi:hypothetical protein